MTDIVKRLRLNSVTLVPEGTKAMCAEAAAEIERLRAVVDGEPMHALNLALIGQLADKDAEIERLRGFAKTVIAMCEPLPPPASNPADPIIASVLVNLANDVLMTMEGF